MTKPTDNYLQLFYITAFSNAFLQFLYKLQKFFSSLKPLYNSLGLTNNISSVPYNHRFSYKLSNSFLFTEFFYRPPLPFQDYFQLTHIFYPIVSRLVYYGANIIELF
jgi:hypothetical protein